MSSLFDKRQSELSTKNSSAQLATKIGTQPPEMTESLRDRKGKAKQLLSFLESRSGVWTPTRQLIPISHRFSASVRTLRLQGYVIDKRLHEKGFWEWKFVGKVEVVTTKKGWQEGYYQSPHWKETRRRRLEHDSWVCCNCKTSGNLHVHHWRYDLFAERLGDLMSLCEDCHTRIHAAVQICFPKSVSVDVFEKLENSGSYRPKRKGDQK